MQTSALAFLMRSECLAEKFLYAALYPAGIDLYGMPLVVVNTHSALGVGMPGEGAVDGAVQEIVRTPPFFAYAPLIVKVLCARPTFS